MSEPRTARQVLSDLAWAYHSEQGHPDPQNMCPEPACQDAGRILRQAEAAAPLTAEQLEVALKVIDAASKGQCAWEWGYVNGEAILAALEGDTDE